MMRPQGRRYRPIQALILTLCLIIWPTHALAELPAQEQTRTTVRNFHYDAGGLSGDIDLDVGMITFDTPDGRAVVQIGALGIGRPLGKVVYASGADQDKLWLDGLTNSYVFTPEGMMAYIAADDNLPPGLSGDAVFRTSSAQLQMLGEIFDPAVCARADEGIALVMADIIARMPRSDAPEAVEVLGETRSLNKCEFVMDNDELDDILGAYIQASPGAEQFFKSFADVMNQAMRYGEPGPLFDGEHMFLWLREMGLYCMVSGSAWLDETGQWGRAEIECRTSDMSARLSGIPIVIEWHENEVGSRTRVTIDADAGSAQTFCRIDMREGADEWSFAAEIYETHSDIVVTDMTMEGAYALGEDGAESLSYATQSRYGWQIARSSFAYEGVVTKTGRAGRVTIGSDTPAFEGEPQTIEIGFDFSRMTEPMDEGILAALDALPSVEVFTMDEQQIEQLEREARTAGFYALGGLMQIPGVARLISEAMSLADALPTPTYVL